MSNYKKLSPKLEDVMLDIGKQLQIKRLRNNMTQAAFAHHAGITASHLSKYEMGKINMEMGSLVNLAAALGCKVTVKIEKIRGEHPEMETSTDATLLNQ